MKIRLTILLLFISLFSFAQQLRVNTAKYQPNSYRNVNVSNNNLASPIYFSQTTDSLKIISYSTSFEGFAWTFTKQVKDIRKLSITYTNLRVGSTTNQINLGCQIWKNGVRQNFNMSEFANYATTGANYFNYNTYTEKVAGQTLTKTVNIDFSSFPSYDSLTFHLSWYFTGTVSGTPGTPIVVIAKNNFTITPIKDAKGLTKCNANLLGFNPDAQLPDTIFMAQNTSLSLYDENVSYVNLNYKDRPTFDWTGSTIGVVTDTTLRIKATTVGNYVVNFKVKDSNGNIRSEQSAVVVVYPKITKAQKIMRIGDSLSALGWNYMFPVLRDSLNSSLTSVGTQGTGYKHEGHSGWTTGTFVGGTSPFVKDGKINFQNYYTANSVAEADILNINLGINDCALATPNSTSLTNLTKLIDSAIVQTSAQIILAMPSTVSDTYDGWFANYPTSTETKYEAYVGCIRSLNKSLYSKFNNYKGRVSVSYETLTIDRNNGYPKTDGVHTNALHPSSSSPTGYKALIKGTLGVLNKINQ